MHIFGNAILSFCREIDEKTASVSQPVHYEDEHSEGAAHENEGVKETYSHGSRSADLVLLLKLLTLMVALDTNVIGS